MGEGEPSFQETLPAGNVKKILDSGAEKKSSNDVGIIRVYISR